MRCSASSPSSTFRHWKIEVELAAIIAADRAQLRGIKESVKFLLPIFIVFLITHAMLIVGSLGLHVGNGAAVVQRDADEVQANPEAAAWA